MTIEMFEVGGCVRDDLLGLPSKDVDFVVIAPSFGAMRDHVQNELGLKIHVEKPDFVTIRAGVPKGHWLRSRCSDADFVLARRDGPSTDGRRPDFVEPGTLEDDLARRDFTVNAIARCPKTGRIIDPHSGVDDLRARELTFVGCAQARIEEDGLRLLRGLRFSLTKNLTIVDPWVFNPLNAVQLLRSVATERIVVELDKMFAFDSLETLRLLGQFPRLQDAIFSRADLSLTASMKKRKVQ